MTQTTNIENPEIRPLAQRTFSEVMQICEDTLIQMVHYQAENEAPVLIDSCQNYANYCFEVMSLMCRDKNNTEAQDFVKMVEENFRVANSVLSSPASTQKERDEAQSMLLTVKFYVETLGLDISMGEGEKVVSLAQKGE